MPPSVSDTLARVAGPLLADTSRVVGTVLEKVADELPALADDPRVREVLASTVHDMVTAALTVLGAGVPVDGVRAPEAALELARRLAQQGVPISTMLRAYRIGQACFQQELIARIAATPADGTQVAAAARDLASVTFSVIDAVSEEVVAAYQGERDRWIRQRNTARLAKVTALLSTRSADAGDVGSTLGYDLTGAHVGAVFWCGADVDEVERLGRLERVVPEVAAALGTSRPPLVVAPDASTLWAWFPDPDAPPDATTDPDAVSDVLADAPGIYASLGDPVAGLAGFRRSHQQAQQTQQIAAAADPAHRARATTSAQLGPLALLAADPGSAAPWVQSALGGLADDDEAAARLRETLWVYLSHGGSLAAAATALHLHKNTIMYRIRKAEQVRGRPLSEGRIDVEVALLACRLLGATVLRPPPEPE